MRSYLNYFLGGVLARNKNKVDAVEAIDLFIEHPYEGVDETADIPPEDLAARVEKFSSLRRAIAHRFPGSNAAIRHRAMRRVVARVRILRKMHEDLKFMCPNFDRNSSADRDYLRARARQLVEMWSKDEEKDGSMVVGQCKNWFMNGLIAVHFVVTEDDALWESLAAQAAKTLPGLA
jgi:hypothetical protein